jgi:predicted GIY-YIG superfamily endonuclease
MAIAAEKKLKKWTRKRKEEIIRMKNPEYEDLCG